MSIEKYILTENSILQHFIEEVCDQNRILEKRNKQLVREVNELKEIINLLERDKEEMMKFLKYQEKLIGYIIK